MNLLALPDHLPEKKPVDLLLALGVGLRRDGTPGPPTTAVAQRTAELAERGFARTILLSGGYRQNGVAEAEAMQSILSGREIQTSILLDCSPAHIGGTPFQPPSAAAIFQSELGRTPDQILLVAHRMHLPRALWLFRRFFRKVEFYWAGAEEVYDPCSEQRRLRGRWRFAIWNLMAWTHHRLWCR
jgi:hypothetical protein